MADIIHLLPDSVANQIAAGEVIQRPASVIKELLENAVDAGAHRIDVVVVDAGRTSIRVTDDGKGMSETDARLAFERHATSKITQADDLFSLTTMGFRGEALPSIAAVSEVTLRTCAAEAEIGTCLTLSGGRVVSQEVASCPVGADFLVQHLFFNVPARRKFLKSNQTELSNIMQEFERVALVNADLRFTFTHDEHLQISLSPEPRKQRIAALFGKKLAEQLLPVEVETTLCTISGFVGKPESARKKGVRQFFYINGRYMRHPYFHKAVQEAFAELIPATDQVPYFLFLQVDPSTIDVNIHPTKTEIKFENEQAIRQILLAAVRETLGRFNAIPTIDFDVEGCPTGMPVYNPETANPNQVSPPRILSNPDYNPFRASAYSSRNTVPTDWKTLYESPAMPTDSTVDVPIALPDDSSLPHVGQEAERSIHHYQYHGRYIVTEVRSGLMLIDQHRAHIRILYETYRAQLSGRPAASQRLLFPEAVQFPVSDAPIVESMQESLRALGFDITPLGRDSYSVEAVPAGFEGCEAHRLIADMVDTLKTKGEGIAGELHHRMALSLARNAAIPVGQVLSQQEMENLVENLFQLTDPNHTPDGHTIVAICPHENLEKLFR